ncbi:MAG: hypothetical protein JO007_06650 [Alphaproteobacteria bacterium]|nr:hypothetical protein [Alphaproteobacteria bacterium]
MRRNKHVPENRADRGRVPAPAATRSFRGQSGFLFRGIGSRGLRNAQHQGDIDVGRRFRCTLRIDCGQLDLDTIIRPISGK